MGIFKKKTIHQWIIWNFFSEILSDMGEIWFIKLVCRKWSGGGGRIRMHSSLCAWRESFSLFLSLLTYTYLFACMWPFMWDSKTEKVSPPATDAQSFDTRITARLTFFFSFFILVTRWMHCRRTPTVSPHRSFPVFVKSLGSRNSSLRVIVT